MPSGSSWRFFSVFGSRSGLFRDRSGLPGRRSGLFGASGLFPGRCGCGRLPKIPDLPVCKKAAGHVRRPFYIQGGPESSEGGRNRSAPGTGRKPQTGRNAAPAIRTGPGTDRNDSRKPKKTARTSRKASRQSETRSPEPKCGRRNETDAVSPESRRFRTEGAGGSAKVRKNRKTFRTVENRIRPAGGRYDFSERKPAETRCRKRPIRNSAE